MTQYHKLVRDKIPDRLDQKGIPYEKTVAVGDELREALVQKLLEEAQEFSEAGAVEELADVLEVVASLRDLPEYADVERIREEKKEERGGFEKGFILKGEK
jgi:predicted house-cleaning noncanonical NTP pyrophosphatase (MazG superfamily)